MKTIKLDMEIRKLDGFNEDEFIEIIRKSLSEVGAKEIRYGKIDNGYNFEIDFEPLLPGFSYQPILGCFSSIEMDYDKVKLIGIPEDKILMD